LRHLNQGGDSSLVCPAILSTITRKPKVHQGTPGLKCLLTLWHVSDGLLARLCRALCLSNWPKT
jgi:hypothetical protein